MTYEPAGREASNRQERGDEKVHGEDPNEDDLPKPEIPRAVMIAGDVRIPFEETFADAEDTKAAEEDDHKKEAEDDSERGYGIAVAMDDAQ